MYGAMHLLILFCAQGVSYRYARTDRQPDEQIDYKHRYRARSTNRRNGQTSSETTDYNKVGSVEKKL